MRSILNVDKVPERVWLTVFEDDQDPQSTMLEWKSPVVRNTQPGDYVATRPHHKIAYVPESLLATVRREAFERACLAICARCRLSEQFTPAERVGEGRRWFHRAANTSFEDGIASQCDAWPIRNLTVEASATEKEEKNG